MVDEIFRGPRSWLKKKCPAEISAMSSCYQWQNDSMFVDLSTYIPLLSLLCPQCLDINGRPKILGLTAPLSFYFCCYWYRNWYWLKSRCLMTAPQCSMVKSFPLCWLSPYFEWPHHHDSIFRKRFSPRLTLWQTNKTMEYHHV